MIYDEAWTGIPHSFLIFGCFGRIKVEFLVSIWGWILVWLRQLETAGFVETISWYILFCCSLLGASFVVGLGQGILAYILDILRAFGAQYRCRKYADHGMDFYAGRQIKIPIGRE